MKTIELADLRADIRLMSDIGESQYFTDDEIDRLINKSIYAFTGRLVALPGADYFETTDDIDVEAGTASYDFPDDCYEVKFLTYTTGGVVYKLKQFNRNDYPVDNTGLLLDIGQLPAFRAIGNTITLIPTPATDYTLVAHYIPFEPGLYDKDDAAIAALSADDDYIDDKWGFTDWVMLDVCCSIKERQEEDTREYRKRQATRWEEISALISDRVQATPKRLPRATHYDGNISGRYPVRR